MWDKYLIQKDKTFRYDVKSLLVGTKRFFVLSQGDILFGHWNKQYIAPWIKIRFLQCTICTLKKAQLTPSLSSIFTDKFSLVIGMEIYLGRVE